MPKNTNNSDFSCRFSRCCTSKLENKFCLSGVQGQADAPPPFHRHRQVLRISIESGHFYWKGRSFNRKHSKSPAISIEIRSKHVSGSPNLDFQGCVQAHECSCFGCVFFVKADGFVWLISSICLIVVYLLLWSPCLFFPDECGVHTNDVCDGKIMHFIIALWLHKTHFI